MPYAIALTHNLKPTIHPSGVPEDAYSEFDSAQTVQAIAAALRASGHHVELVEATWDLPAWFRTHPVDLVFNIAEGMSGESRESRVPAILDFLGIPYTGSGVLSLALALDKATAKYLFQASGIPTPAFQLFTDPEQLLEPPLRFPLMVKPNREGSGKGIWARSVVTTHQELQERVREVGDRYDQPVLVEEFIEGLELSVGIFGNMPSRTFPILEVDFSTCDGSGEWFYSWRMKEFQGNQALHLTPTFWCPARLPESVAARVQATALAAHAALDCRDFSRVDLRLDRHGTPYVLEVNPLPGLDPEDSNFPKMAKVAGVTYEALIHGLVEHVAARTIVSSSIMHPRHEQEAPAAPRAGGMAASRPLEGGR